ncbi:MAG: LacI family transcriptional regulator [Butyrivibrio sp.]|jgi:LacI family transcriptional regulator|uniref:LacI family DNA-binding transcriptional regulator n=1 Tax=Butyrivibrio sp. TaxID=28121 RepID=UPI001EB77CDD|nr:LacI family DNA-binding transcriptional regulator [Butyrivibrio sp.]MBE5840894.1 LacI family transcriptional regulator [Butyrivibrio sp.]MCR4757353.1 LacI family transcriptional regulator [Butyrivibrio sp.]
MITIKEIAKQLNMSTTTVSNVIHGKTGEVSEETTKIVQDFLKKVDYVPNINARNLAQNESKIIGLALKARADKYENLIMDPFVSVLIGGVEETIRNAGYFMMLYISSDTTEIMRHVSTWNVDGLILFGMLNDDGIRVSEKYKKPIVCIDTYSIEGLKHFTNVGLDDEQGTYDMVTYLISQGHRKIAFLSDNMNGVDLARLNGYKKALKDNNIKYSDSNFLKIRPKSDEVEYSLEEICRKARDFTAIMCVSDLYAITLMAALEDRGISVPNDISIVGFDDNMLGQLHRPALTTVHQDVKEKGIVAARTLLQQLNKQKTPNQILLPTHLVIRDTVKKLT